MKRKIIKTADGSTTIHLEEWNEHYHSKHGAIQEAYHVFVKNGLDLFNGEVSILEIGFGTGLNAFITLLEARRRGMKVHYEGVEGYPVSLEEVSQLNYAEQLKAAEMLGKFNEMHSLSWNTVHHITDSFSLVKREQKFESIEDTARFNLIYFDAFGARVQPDLWTEDIFSRMYRALLPGGVLVTYAAKGSVRRAMLAAGFMVQKLPGPPGKREMLRASK